MSKQAYLLRRLRTLLAQEGYVGTGRAAALYGIRQLDALRPSERRRRRQGMDEQRSIDERYGIRTSRVFMAAEGDVVGPNWLRGIKYEPVPPSFDLAAALAACEPRLEEHVFVDIGAGMGRVLFLAAGLPFKRLIGVEYSGQLADIARDNLIRSHAPEIHGREITIVRADALAFELPPDPLVLFLFNPFLCDVMQSFVEGVRASFLARPRRIIAVYVTPRCAQIWHHADFISYVGEFGGALVFDTGVVA